MLCREAAKKRYGGVIKALNPPLSLMAGGFFFSHTTARNRFGPFSFSTKCIDQNSHIYPLNPPPSLMAGGFFFFSHTIARNRFGRFSFSTKCID